MTRTVTAMFDRYQDAAEAVRRLEAIGLDHSAVSLVSNDPANRERLAGESDNTPTTPRAATTLRDARRASRRRRRPAGRPGHDGYPGRRARGGPRLARLDAGRAPAPALRPAA